VAVVEDIDLIERRNLTGTLSELPSPSTLKGLLDPDRHSSCCVENHSSAIKVFIVLENREIYMKIRL